MGDCGGCWRGVGGGVVAGCGGGGVGIGEGGFGGGGDDGFFGAEFGEFAFLVDHGAHVGVGAILELAFDVFEGLELLLGFEVEAVDLAVDFLSLPVEVIGLVADGSLEGVDLFAQAGDVLAHFEQGGVAQGSLRADLFDLLLGVVAGEVEFLLQGLIVALLLPVGGEEETDQGKAGEGQGQDGQGALGGGTGGHGGGR